RQIRERRYRGLGQSVSVVECDVLVVGAGLAGQMAALEAARQGKSVVMLSKVELLQVHSTLPEGGINLAATDAWRQHVEDVWNDGFFLSDYDAAEAACKLGPEIVRREFGDLLPLNDEGELVTTPGAG